MRRKDHSSQIRRVRPRRIEWVGLCVYGGSLLVRISNRVTRWSSRRTRAYGADVGADPRWLEIPEGEQRPAYSRPCVRRMHWALVAATTTDGYRSLSFGASSFVFRMHARTLIRRSISVPDLNQKRPCFQLFQQGRSSRQQRSIESSPILNSNQKSTFDIFPNLT
jgi:hypothetical protein